MNILKVCKSYPINFDDLKSCIEKGEDINQQDQIGKSPFSWICYQSARNKFNLDILKLCVKGAKGDINLKDKDNMTPFGWLCIHSQANGFDENIMKYCIRFAGADLNIQNTVGRSPIYWLCGYGYKINWFKIIKHCINVDINVKDNYGVTPIYWLCFHDYTDKRKTLKWFKNNFTVKPDSLEHCKDIYKVFFMKPVIVDANIDVSRDKHDESIIIC